MAQGFLISSQQISFPNYICPILMTWCLNTDHLGAKRDEPDCPGEIMLGLQLGPKMMILSPPHVMGTQTIIPLITLRVSDIYNCPYALGS